MQGRFPKLTAACALFLAACGAATPAPASPPPSVAPSSAASAAVSPKPGKVVFGLAPLSNIADFSFDVARDKGFFTQQGIDAELISAAPAAVLAGLSSGSIQFTNYTASATHAAVEGLPVRILAYIQTEPFSLVAQPRVHAVSELKGMTVGNYLSPGDDNYLYILAALKTGGLTDKDVSIISGSSDPAPLLANQIAAQSFMPPVTQTMAAKGYNVLTGPDVANLPSNGIGTSADLLQKNPQLVRSVLSALLDAIAWTRSHPDDAVAYFQTTFSVPQDIAKATYDQQMAALRLTLTDEQLQTTLAGTLAQLKRTENVPLNSVYDLTLFRELVKAKGLA